MVDVCCLPQLLSTYILNLELTYVVARLANQAPGSSSPHLALEVQTHAAIPCFLSGY